MVRGVFPRHEGKVKFRVANAHGRGGVDVWEFQPARIGVADRRHKPVCRLEVHFEDFERHAGCTKHAASGLPDRRPPHVIWAHTPTRSP